MAARLEVVADERATARRAAELIAETGSAATADRGPFGFPLSDVLPPCSMLPSLAHPTPIFPAPYTPPPEPPAGHRRREARAAGHAAARRALDPRRPGAEREHGRRRRRGRGAV